MLVLTFLCLVLYFDHVTSLNVACVCTSHVSSRLYDRPNSHSNLIGFLYQDECKQHKPAFDKNGFYAVLHFHKITYIHADFGVVSRTCFDFHLDPNDKLITTKSPYAAPSATSSKTTSPATGSRTTPSANGSQTMASATSSRTVSSAASSYTMSSVTGFQATPSATVVGSQMKLSTSIHHATPSGAQHHTTSKIFHTKTTQMSRGSTAYPSARCNKFAIFVDVAKELNVGLWNSVRCPDNIHHSADVFVSALCGAPSSRQWIRGPHAFSNCDRLAHFIPVARFDHTGTYKHYAGVLLGCNKQAMHVVTQNCSTGLHITEITTKGTPNVNDFYVVEW